MNNVVLIYNSNKQKSVDLAHKIETVLQKEGIKTTICKTGSNNSELQKLNGNLELAIVLGGDGTLLGASRALAPKGIPLFGINTGRLGFLTEGDGKHFEENIDRVLNNKFEIEERAMLSSVIVDKSGVEKGTLIALNEAVISRGISNKMIYMTLNVDDTPVADYWSDGLIISTPTGTTAYALSAGGAIVDPLISGIEIVPICAHSLTSRPHIISDSRKITITFKEAYEGVILQTDGHEIFNLSPESRVEIKRAKHNAKLIRLQGNENNFYWRIRQKFHWGKA